MIFRTLIKDYQLVIIGILVFIQAWQTDTHIFTLKSTTRAEYAWSTCLSQPVTDQRKSTAYPVQEKGISVHQYQLLTYVV